MMADALQHKGVTVLFEEREIPDAELPAPELQHGDRLTIVSYGRTMHMVRRNPPEEAQLVDLRWLQPLNVETVLESAERTGAVLIIEPSPGIYGVGAEVAARTLYALPLTDVVRLSGLRAFTPLNRLQQMSMHPGPEDIDRIWSLMRRDSAETACN
jgi:pyruvate/2-oxoglutarate/acetoin dehydrogenase E1 component